METAGLGGCHDQHREQLFVVFDVLPPVQCVTDLISDQRLQQYLVYCDYACSAVNFKSNCLTDLQGGAKKRGHPISLQIFWKLHDRIAQKYCKHFLAYLLIIVCFDDVTLAVILFSVNFIEILLSFIHTVQNRFEHHTVAVQVAPQRNEIFKQIS